MMMELAYVNGVFGRLADAKVSIEDRGFQFGDGIYEVVVAHDGRPTLLAQHMERLRGSARAIGLEYDFDAEPLEPIIEEGLSRAGAVGDAMIYIQMTRGACPRAHVVPDWVKPTVVMTFKPLPEVPERLRREGARIMTVPETRWSKCYIKAITLLPNLLAKNEALARGCDEALFVSEKGEVRECTSANLFIVKDGDIMIPPRTEAVLHGVTQGFLMECASDLGLSVKEMAFNVETLLRADEAFISSALIEVVPVALIDDQPIGDGKVGPMTERLCDEFINRSHSRECTEIKQGSLVG